MNSEQLRYFELAYTERNFSAAARKVPVSHQALTKAIRALERELDVPLFSSDPETGMPVPTPFAHELFEFAAVYDSNLRLLKESFDRIRGTQNATVRLGCCLGVLGAYGPGLLQGFMQTNPGAHIPYWESKDDLCEHDFLAGIYDIALMVLPITPGCVGQVLYRSPVYFWVRTDDPLATKTSLHIEDLSHRDIAIPGTGFKCYDHLLRAASEHGVELGSIFETSEIFRLYGFVADGLGLGFSNGTLIDLPAFTRDDSIIALPVEGLTWGFAIERMGTHALSELETQLWNRCASAARLLPRNDIAL